MKICGITRLEDAQMAVQHGVHALGFIFWPGSPRLVSPERARAIIAEVSRSVTTVGVFVNQTAAHVNAVADHAGLTAVQLHGDETPAFVAEMTRPVIKAVVLGEEAVPLTDWPEEVMLLADARDPVRRGGTGIASDWSAAATLAGRRRLLLPAG